MSRLQKAVQLISPTLAFRSERLYFSGFSQTSDRNENWVESKARNGRLLRNCAVCRPTCEGQISLLRDVARVSMLRDRARNVCSFAASTCSGPSERQVATVCSRRS